MKREEAVACLFADLSLAEYFQSPCPRQPGSRSKLSVSTPCSQRASGNFPAQGNNAAKLPTFILERRVIQVAFSFQHG